MADVQTPEVPQTQGAGLAVAPSPWGQAGAVKDPTDMCAPAILLHEFLEASQNSPVVAASQSVVPQAQLAPLAAVPSVVVQVLQLVDVHTWRWS